MVAEINESPVLHIRYDGRSFDIPLSDLDVGSMSSDTDVKRALAGYLNVPEAKFRDYPVDRHDTGNVTVAPKRYSVRNNFQRSAVDLPGTRSGALSTADSRALLCLMSVPNGRRLHTIGRRTWSVQIPL